MSASELVDVVDADDRVIGRATRAEVRAQQAAPPRHLHPGLQRRTANCSCTSAARRRTSTRRTTTSPSAAWSAPARATTRARGASSPRRSASRSVAPRPILKFQYEDADNRVNGRVYSCSYDGAADAAGGRDRRRRVARSRRRDRAHPPRAVLPGRRRGAGALPRQAGQRQPGMTRRCGRASAFSVAALGVQRAGATGA